MSNEDNAYEVLVEQINELEGDLEEFHFRMTDLEKNVQSIIGMMTQMNISLLQIQSDLLKEDK